MQYWKKTVSAHIIGYLSEKSKTLDPNYKDGYFEFDTGTAKKQVRPFVWANAADLLDSVIEQRNIIGNILIKVMCDGGQEFLELSMSVFPEDYLYEYQSVSSDEDTSSEIKDFKRMNKEKNDKCL